MLEYMVSDARSEADWEDERERERQSKRTSR
jgi:hypothetical protein